MQPEHDRQWWGHSSEHGWIVLDRDDPKNRGESRYLVRCRDWVQIEVSRADFGSDRFRCSEKYIATLPVDQQSEACVQVCRNRQEFAIRAVGFRATREEVERRRRETELETVANSVRGDPHDAIIYAFLRVAKPGDRKAIHFNRFYPEVTTEITTCHKGGDPGYTHIHGPSRLPTPPKCANHPLVIECYNGAVGFDREPGMRLQGPLGSRPSAEMKHDRPIQEDPLGRSCIGIGRHVFVFLPQRILDGWGTFESFAQNVIEECRCLRIW
jgi:hypothetical protein